MCTFDSQDPPSWGSCHPMQLRLVLSRIAHLEERAKQLLDSITALEALESNTKEDTLDEGLLELAINEESSQLRHLQVSFF